MPRNIIPIFSVTFQDKVGDPVSYELLLRYADGTKRYFSTPTDPVLTYKNPTQYFRDMFPEANLEKTEKI